MKESTRVEQDLRRFIRENLAVTVSLDATKSNPKLRRKLQHFLSVKHANTELQTLYETLLSHAVQAESMCPNAGMALLSIFANNKLEELNTTPQNKDDLLSLLRKNFDSGRVYSLLECALDNCGSTTKLSIKKSNTNQSYVESSEGYGFTLKPLMKSTSVSVKNVSIACIDGFIESVSEIHHLLTSLSESKKTCFLFARGMSDEVLHTIKVNHDRKTLLVFPYLVPYDLENVNTLVDIAVVSGTDVISSLKGELISSMSIDKLGFVEECLTSGDTVRMRNSKTAKSVRNHVENLKKKLEERQEIESILSKRLRSLTSSCVDICIPDDLEYYSVSQQLDEGIRIISSVLSNSYDPLGTAKKVHDSFVETVTNRTTCLL